MNPQYYNSLKNPFSGVYFCSITDLKAFFSNEANLDETVLLALQILPPPPSQLVSHSYQRMKLRCFSSALCLDPICTDNVIKIHQMSALVRSNASHFRASGDPSDLVYAVLLLYIGPALNSPWRRAYQEQTHISPSAPQCICGRWVSTKTSTCAR